MRKTLMIVAITVAALLVTAIVLALASGWLSERKRTRLIELKVTSVPFVSDAAALERGQYLYASRGCMECHGSNGAGKEVIDDPGGMYIKSPNISPGPGSVAKDYNETDWVRTIRHGVTPSKHPMILMPSKDYSRLTDEDLSALVAYVRALPPAVGERSVIRFRCS